MLNKKIKLRRKITKMEYTYAALLLHKTGKEINEDNLKKVVTAAGVEANESKIKSLVASLKGVDIDKELESAATSNLYLLTRNKDIDESTLVEIKTIA